MEKRILELYSDYFLSSCNYTTPTGLATALAGQIRHDKLTRFFVNGFRLLGMQ